MFNREYEQALSLLPSPDASTVAIAPPGAGQGYWAGASSAAADGEDIYLAYRLRRPVGAGRGYAIVIAHSRDGVAFQPVTMVTRDYFHAESLERPRLVLSPAGRWRLYVSCATPGTKHWRVELLEADHPSHFDLVESLVVLPGDTKTAVKDPVIRYQHGLWQLWASCHPLADPDEADQMVTDFATSEDGLEWTWHGTALAGRDGQWDSRGTRVTAVCDTGGAVVAFYDGRASAAENYEERTGIAIGSDPAALSAMGTAPAVQSPYARHGLRYMDILPLPGGRYRIYYEMSRPDGAHELRTELR